MTRLTIVRGAPIILRSPANHRSYKPVRGLMRNIGFGLRTEHRTVPRGQWIDQAGIVHQQRSVEAWAKEKVHRFGYDHAYQLLLSTGQGRLDSADFNTALQTGSDISNVREWRMMLHADTNNQHAHAILFRHEPLSRKQYLAWQQSMQQTLDKRQMERLLEQEQSLGRGEQRAQSAEISAPQQEHSWGIER